MAFRPGLFPISFGFTGRYIFRDYVDNEFTSYDPLFAANGLRVKAISADFGFQAELGRRVTLAGVARNLISPDMGIGEEDVLPIEVSLGMTFYPRFITPVVQVDWSLDDVDGARDIDFAFGLEKWFGTVSSWGFRTGYRARTLGRTSEISHSTMPFPCP